MIFLGVSLNNTFKIVSIVKINNSKARRGLTASLATKVKRRKMPSAFRLFEFQ